MTEARQVPRVSVVIASYNYQQYIGEAIDSVLAQTYQDWQLVIVDDASTDDSPNIIKQYQRQHPCKIKFISLSENRGIGYVANLCYDNCEGQLIAHLGADDRMVPDRLAQQVAYFDSHPEAGVVCSDVFVIDGEGRRVETKTVFSTPITDLRMQLLQGNIINSPSATFRKNVFTEAGKLNPVLQYVQDFEHWLRVLEKFEIVRLDEKLTEYRIHGKNLSVQKPGQHAYAGSYETVISVLRAIDRRNRILHSDVQIDQDALIQKKLQLAQAAIDVEMKYLQQFKFASALVYFIVLEIFELNPDCDEATKLLQEVYRALGDTARAEGKKPYTVNEFNQNRHQSRGNIPTTPLDLAIETATGLNQPLPDVVAKIISNTANGKINATAKEQLLLQMAEYLIKAGLKDVDYHAGKGLGRKRRSELNRAQLLLNEQYDAGEESMAISQIKQQLVRLLEHDDYQIWMRKHELREVDAEILAERMMLHWPLQPVMHCFMFVLPGEESLLADTIDSLAGQLLKSWQLTVVAATPAPDPIFEQADFLHWRTLDSSDDANQVLNEEISRYPSHWVSFIEPGMQFRVHSLAKIADYINLYPGCSFIYSDDDQIDQFHQRSHPRFKPDFNLDLLRSSPYIGNGWMPAGHLIQLGGIQKLAGAENYDLALRWYDSFGETAFCHIPDVLIHKSSQVDRPFDAIAGEQALQQHFERNAVAVKIEAGYVDNSYRVEYLHQQQPKVTIIIPTKDKLEFFQPCIETLLEKTRYPDYEVLVVDNQSTDPDTLAYYRQLSAEHGDRVRVLFYDKPFNFAAINNWAAEQATGEFLLLLNNDTEIIQGDWLSRMMVHGQREDVGIVGARLLYPGSGRVQHIGVILGIRQIADHHYCNMLALNDSSHMERARLDQNFSAVTAAVMLVKREVYLQVGGMDVDHLAVLFNDVDFCLRVGERGYRIVWTPYAMVVHHGSTSVGEKQESSFYYDWQGYGRKAERTRAEQRYMLQQWLPVLANDPAYNRNLTLRSHHFGLDLNGMQNWDLHHHLRLRCFGVPIRGGSGAYRMTQPFNALAKAGRALCEVGDRHLTITELVRLQPDTVVFQNAISNSDLEYLQMYREFSPDTHIVFLLDDLLHDLPERSSQYKKLKAAYRDARSRLRRALSYCDRLIVSTQPLAELCEDMIDDISLIPNRLQKAVWLGLESQRNQGAKPRVGWAGAQQHQGDLDIITDVVKETASEIDWIFFGMCPEEIKPFIKEEHDFVDIDDYPQKLASLNLDLALAPLEMHDFNKAKSNLRLLEYGILGWPVICSDIFPYQINNAPVIRVNNDKAAWLAAIRQALADPLALQQSGNRLKQWVIQHYLLEDHLDEWLQSLTAIGLDSDFTQLESVSGGVAGH
ncbi:glycosyltransferase [Methylophaga sp. OBS4]|uniref:glycosyltransferase n=1 Tax=Methylophaga sp. OBS4 TaxID=2991935 RepID=UPI00225388F7|nr:glycosyltransferase [Methylophaga sp. OBS4]MCX4187367.1 glycosyltransferase [Methylophaga sp. OBS4]